MSRASWDRRLRALEQRPSAQRPIKIIGGLPSGFQMIESLAKAREPLTNALPVDDCAPAQTAPAQEPNDQTV